jgi:hypothetical protein
VRFCFCRLLGLAFLGCGQSGFLTCLTTFKARWPKQINLGGFGWEPARTGQKNKKRTGTSLEWRPKFSWAYANRPSGAKRFGGLDGKAVSGFEKSPQPQQLYLLRI